MTKSELKEQIKKRRAAKVANNAPLPKTMTVYDDTGKIPVGTVSDADLKLLNKPVVTTAKPATTGRVSSGYQNWCRHAGKDVLFTIDGVNIRAAARSDIVEVTGCLRLNCTGLNADDRVLTAVPAGFESLHDYAYNTRTITVDWSDGDSPELTPEFWLALPRLAKEKGIKDIIAYCMGSHGRTGTALAAMAIVNLGMNAITAASFIRRKHCDHAIETYRQCDYLVVVEEWAYCRGLIDKLSPLPIEPSGMSRISRSVIPADPLMPKVVVSTPAAGHVTVTDFDVEAWREQQADLYLKGNQ